MIGVQDSNFRARHEARERQQAERQRTLDYLAREYEYCQVVANPESSPANLARQMGRTMSTTEFELLIKKLSPDLWIEKNPANSYGSVYWRRVDPKTGRTVKYRVCGCEWGVMPEYSLMEAREVELPVVQDVMSRDTPAFIREKQVKQELIRGWRTVLLRLVHEGVVSANRVESAAGVSGRASWAAHLRKQTDLKVLF